MKDIKIRLGISLFRQEEDSTQTGQNKFETKCLNIDELKETIEQSSYLTIPRSVSGTYTSPSVTDFEEIYIMAFNIDKADYSLNEFRKRIHSKFIPTFSFKTRNNNDIKKEFSYRLIYVFRQPFCNLEDYYIYYHYMLGMIEMAAGEFDDGYAYGLNPVSAGVLGSIHKAIGCVHQGDIHYSNRIYSKGMILSSKQLMVLKEYEENSKEIVKKVMEWKVKKEEK